MEAHGTRAGARSIGACLFRVCVCWYQKDTSHDPMPLADEWPMNSGSFAVRRQWVGPIGSIDSQQWVLPSPVFHYDQTIPSRTFIGGAVATPCPERWRPPPRPLMWMRRRIPNELEVVVATAAGASVPSAMVPSTALGSMSSRRFWGHNDCVNNLS